MLTVKCTSARLNHVAFETDGKGVKKPHRIRVGDTFKVKAIPAHWVGLVDTVSTEGKTKTKAKVTNPAKGAQGNPDQADLEELRLKYEAAEGKKAPAQWGVAALTKALAPQA
jgi:hypothetical protein